MYSDTRAEGFGAEVKRRIMLGTYVLSAGYYDAYYLQRAEGPHADRARLRRRPSRRWTPSSARPRPAPAFKLGEKADDPLQMYLADIFTISCNLAGLPACRVPCGFTEARLPIGLQILGSRSTRRRCFRVGAALERRR